MRCIVSVRRFAILAAMRPCHVIACLCLLGLLSAPAVALAQGGSAGDQQYTDPLAGTTTGSHTSTQPASTTPASSPTTSSTPATPTPASSTPATTTPAPSGQATTAAPATSDSAAPTATTASSGTGSQKTLPFTGIDLWAVAGIGLSLTASGLLIRLRARA